MADISDVIIVGTFVILAQLNKILSVRTQGYAKAACESMREAACEGMREAACEGMRDW